jgi:hypothetical protein
MDTSSALVRVLMKEQLIRPLIVPPQRGHILLYQGGFLGRHYCGPTGEGPCIVPLKNAPTTLYKEACNHGQERDIGNVNVTSTSMFWVFEGRAHVMTT